MKVVLYRIWQCTWGILQTIVGFIMFLKYFKNKHYTYHGAVITEWNANASVSLGLFVFIAREEPWFEKFKDEMEGEEIYTRLLVHEYGHTIQSLILGPLYLIVIGFPSTIWGFLFEKKRKEEQIPYGTFFTEKWANKLGERVTGEKSIDMLVID
ncbi:MAG: hypothetical protein J6C06_01235 [Lachnospiraceae bacterium]|nr:hypothetical protein [Lachnospiraceae bacterium]